MMNQEEFEKRMEDIDFELIKKDITVKGRPFAALDIFCPNSSFSLSPLDKRFFGEFQGVNLFDKIQSWYRLRYASKMLSEFKIGKKPFKLKGEIYYINYPVVVGKTSIDVLNLVEDLTNSMKCSLSETEQQYILKEFELGYYAFNEITNLENSLKHLHKETIDYILRGVVDVEASASKIIDIQNTIFHSHQASEKFLKALWVELSNQKNPGKNISFKTSILAIKHDLMSLYCKLPKSQRNKKKIYPQVKYLHDLVPNMDIRYKDLGKTLDEAVCAINYMLQICKFVCEQIAAAHSHSIREVSNKQEYEEGLVKIYIDKLMALGIKASQGQELSIELENAVRECIEHFAIVESSTEIGNLKHLAGKIKVFFDSNQQSKEWNDTLSKILKLLEARIAEIGKEL